MKKISLHPRLVIAGLKGGSGKTTLSVGLIASWRKEGLDVVPYKKGPDYIDAGWLSSAAGRPCYNLDPFLIGKEKVLSSFSRHYGDANCAVIEGNRGLYDGMDEAGTYSTAELAKLLKSPVILIVDCTKVTRTSAAMVMGMQKFDRRVDIRGVVLNRVAGSRHERVVKESIERYCGIPVLGVIPKLGEDVFAERHMGLVPFQEHPDVESTVVRAAEIAEKYLDSEALRRIANDAGNLDGKRETQGKRREKASEAVLSPGSSSAAQHRPQLVTIGIIRDSAFQFYYPENFEALEEGGARLLEVSALKEERLPDLDALYIGGGFPETNAIALAKNSSFRKSLRRAVEDGLPVYAECGGLMYLGKSLSLGGKSYPMTGVFPLTFQLERRPQAHGYTIAEVARTTPFYEKNVVLKGHEFHYSRVSDPADSRNLNLSFTMKRGQGILQKRDGLCYKNVLATYTHVHAYGAPEWARGLIRRALLYKKEKSEFAGKKK